MRNQRMSQRLCALTTNRGFIGGSVVFALVLLFVILGDMTSSPPPQGHPVSRTDSTSSSSSSFGKTSDFENSGAAPPVASDATKTYATPPQFDDEDDNGVPPGIAQRATNMVSSLFSSSRPAPTRAIRGQKESAQPGKCVSVDDHFTTKTFVAGNWFDDQVRVLTGRAEGARWIGILGKGLPDYLRANGWREVNHPAEASLLVTRVFYHAAVPWNAVAQGYRALAVSTFPKRSPYSLFSGCRIGVKESLYACLMDLHDMRPDLGVLDWFSPSFVFNKPATRAELHELEQRFMEFHRRHTASDEHDHRWFVKPGGSVVGGVGIEIFNEPADMVNHARKLLRKKHKDKYQVLGYDERAAVVIQKKIPNLFKLGDRLMDLRVMVVVTSIEPREVFWMPTETLIRKTGSTSGTDDTTDRKKLLVNFSFHKNPDNVLQVQEMQRELSLLSRPDGEPGTMWDLFEQNTVPSITRALSAVFSLPLDWQDHDRAFAALGCDFMLDATTLKGNFIECNDGPMYFGEYIPKHKPMFMERIYPKMLDLVANTNTHCPGLEDRMNVIRLDTANTLSDEQLVTTRNKRHQSELMAASANDS